MVLLIHQYGFLEGFGIQEAHRFTLHPGGNEDYVHSKFQRGVVCLVALIIKRLGV